MADVFPSLDDAEQKVKKLRICVTGATGYLAGHIIKRLLAAGHTVHGTARHPASSPSTAHLHQMEGAAHRLKLFKADLLLPGAFDAAVAGCDVVIHTASPYQLDVPKGKEDELMIRPAIFGTENVLSAVNKAPSVTRVVLTASTVSVWGDPHERGKGHTFTEDDWNCTATPTAFPYFYSKTAAEKRAYAMREEAGGRWELCSINPGAIWGPPTGSRTDGESVGQMIDLLSGAFWPWSPPLGVGVVDVRDAARAHCLAAVLPRASGRYLINSESTYVLPTAAKILSKAYPKRWLPPLKPPLFPLLAFGPMMGLPTNITRATFRKKPLVCVAKAAKELGMTQYISVQQSVLDMARDMLAKGMIPAWKMPIAAPVLVLDVLIVVGLLWGLATLFRSVAQVAA
ncbi:heme peroxidase-related protein [Scenedesmus sp. NREL 46B-D3]|nr:heme peroxidase-related protein [Scenedesmus sp. NREL 46B-D3]